MATRGVYGIEHVKLMAAKADGTYPDFDTLEDGFQIHAIVKDSASFNDTESSVENIEIEDSDLPFHTIETDKGSRGFTLQTYDMGADAYEYLLGFEKDPSTEWYEEQSNFVLPNQAVELLTKAYGVHKAVLYQWANMKCVVSRTGTLGKSGFPNFQLAFTQNVNRNSAGQEISGCRFKEVAG